VLQLRASELSTALSGPPGQWREQSPGEVCREVQLLGTGGLQGGVGSFGFLVRGPLRRGRVRQGACGGKTLKIAKGEKNLFKPDTF
jgi:hypothetical protein